MTACNLRVAYVMSRFPKLSETFVLYEMLALDDLGVEIGIYPLIHEREPVAHADVARVRDRVYRPRPIVRTTLAALAHYARRKPGVLFGVGWQIARGSAGSRRMLLASIATIPRAVAFARAFENARVRHIHAHFATHATTAALIAHRLTGIPFSFTAHAHDIYVDQRLLCVKTAEAAFVVAISEYNRGVIARACGQSAHDKTQVVHCGVDTSLFAPPERERDGPFRIVCVGSLEEKKGQRYLIEACRQLRAQGVAFECVLIGDGACREALVAQAAAADLTSVVRFLGGQPRDVVLAMVRDAGAVVLPSVVTGSGKMEGIPVALMEALACARAVVATRISGVPELVVDGETGLLVAQRDSAALAAALARLQSDSVLRQRLGAAGRRKVCEEFDLRANADVLRALFAQSAQE